MAAATKEVEYKAEKNPVTAELVSVSQTSATIKFSQPVKGLTKDQFYHTYTAWQAGAIEADGKPLDPNEYYDEVKVIFAAVVDGEVVGRALVEGTVTIGVEKGDAEDRWGNPLAENITLQGNVTADREAPKVTKVKVEDQQFFTVTFSEDVDKASAEDTDNYEILTDKGEEVKVNINSAVVDPENAAKVKVSLSSALEPGTYKFTVKNVKDASIAQNKMASYTETVEVKNEEAPVMKKAEIVLPSSKGKYTMYLTFDKEMNSTSVTNKANYEFYADGKMDLDGATFSMFNDKVVKVVLSDKDGAPSMILYSKLEAKDGNKSGLAAMCPVEEIAAPKAGEATKISASEVEVKFDSELKSFDKSKIFIDDLPVSTVTIKNDGDKTKVVLKFAGEAKELLNEDGDTVAPLAEINFAEGAFTSTTGVATAETTGIEIADGVAPEILKDTYFYGDSKPVKDAQVAFAVDDDHNGRVDGIVIFYTEELESASVNKYTYSVSGATVVDAQEVEEGIVLIAIEEDDTEDLAYTDITKTFSVTQKNPVYDLEGNELASATIKAQAAAKMVDGSPVYISWEFWD
jgi:hypothetical protein